MRLAVALVRTSAARACLSLTTQVLYSFCWTPPPGLTTTEPWQLGEAHDPGPVYCGIAGFCATPATVHSARQTTSRIRNVFSRYTKRNP